MKKIEIEVPDGKRAEWINGVLTLVDEPKKCHEFKIGDKVILNRDVCFTQASGDFSLVKAGAEVEIIKITDKAGSTEKIYDIKYQNFSTGVVFGCDIHPYVPEDITERIKTFEDAYRWCEENAEVNLVNQYDDWEIYDDSSKDVIAYLKLRIITCALNEGWEPTFEEDEERWRVVYEAMDDSYDSGCSLKWETTPNKFILKSERLAEYAAHQFRDIYANFCGCKKGGEK